MKFKILLIMALCYVSAVFAVEPSPNLMIYKEQLLKYYDSGNYMHDISIVDQQAETYLDQRVQKNNAAQQPKKLAVVFDIDETALSNFKYLRDADFGFEFKTMDAEQSKADDSVISGTLALYQEAVKDRAAIFFITGRKENLREATAKNLHNAGYTTWTELFLKPMNYQSTSAVIYKTAIRKKIAREGYDIVFSIGDQQSDLIGGYADKTFKLPNPYYFIP